MPGSQGSGKALIDEGHLISHPSYVITGTLEFSLAGHCTQVILTDDSLIVSHVTSDVLPPRLLLGVVYRNSR